MYNEWKKEDGRWHGIVVGGKLHGFCPHPQATFKSMKIIMRIDGGGFIYHRSLPWLAIRVFEKSPHTKQAE